MKRFFKENILNCIIYIIAILMSLICLVLYFVECEKSDELKNFFLSIGTSIFASALLAFTIEYSNYIRFEKGEEPYQENPSSSTPRIIYGDQRNSMDSDRFLENGSYFRLKNISVASRYEKCSFNSA